MTRHAARGLALALVVVLAGGGCAAQSSSAIPASPSASAGSGAPSGTASPTGASASPSVVASVSPSASRVPASATPAASTQAPPSFGHVYVVVMENREYDTVVGSGDAPYLNELIARYGLVTGMHAETHPSEPNYLALVSGDTQGVRDDGVYNFDAPTVFDQVEATGRTWRVYEQGYPGSCSAAAFGSVVTDGPGQPGEYARKHDPAISFTSISRNPSRCARITGLAGFDPAAADLELIVPNQVNDMHSSSTATGDAFLRAFLPSILESPAFAAGSLLVVTWDEGGSNDGGGGHIATVVATPGMARGTRLGGATTHYSILRAIEDAWGMPRLGGAAEATALDVAP